MKEKQVGEWGKRWVAAACGRKKPAPVEISGVAGAQEGVRAAGVGSQLCGWGYGSACRRVCLGRGCRA